MNWAEAVFASAFLFEFFLINILSITQFAEGVAYDWQGQHW